MLSCAALALSLFAAMSAARRRHREALYFDMVLTAADLYDVPPSLVFAVIRTESDFNKDAVSAAGATGLMQLMPDTFVYIRDELLFETTDESEIADPAVNIRYGTRYLAYLLDRFENERDALAAYNAGEGRVSEWLAQGEGEIPFAETAAYVKKVAAAREQYQKKYNLS